MRPVRVEVITYTPTFFFHCQHCELTFQEMGVGGAVHREQAREALPEDLRQEFQALSLWAHDLVERFGRSVRLRVLDAASIEGFWKSLRHGIRRYPAVIIEGKDKFVGPDLHLALSAIEHHVEYAESEPEKPWKGGAWPEQTG
jgi:hypothetical protein